MLSKRANAELLSSIEGGAKLPIAEHFYSIQGEGANVGRPAYFIRLAGCDVGCPWCDAKESWSAKNYPLMSCGELVDIVLASGAKYVCITGGEPMIYPLGLLCDALHERGLILLLESSGSHPMSGSFDWICISPKSHRPPLDEAYGLANELKIIVSHKEDLLWAESCAAKSGTSVRLFLQVEWEKAEEITPAVVDYVKLHPEWSISVQIHKYIHVP